MSRHCRSRSGSRINDKNVLLMLVGSVVGDCWQVVGARQYVVERSGRSRSRKRSRGSSSSSSSISTDPRGSMTVPEGMVVRFPAEKIWFCVLSFEEQF